MERDEILQHVIRIAEEQLQGSAGATVDEDENAAVEPDTELETVGMDSTASKLVSEALFSFVGEDYEIGPDVFMDNNTPRKLAGYLYELQNPDQITSIHDFIQRPATKSALTLTLGLCRKRG